MSLSAAQKQVAAAALRSDLPLAASLQYKIKDKAGSIVPLTFNRAQTYAHAQLERQLSETGKVRALVLKGRQQGLSTYIAARFYHRVTYSFGLEAYIMAHEDKATANLYRIVKRLQQYNPGAPPTGATNAHELIFPGLNGGYRLGTAGSRNTGRSATVQLFHGSEAAFWANLPEQLAGIGNSVADAAGTEIILETTANGEGTPFHQLWLDAVRGESEYIAVFIPWFWEPGYTAPLPGAFVLSEEEATYKEAHNLTDAQIAWRRAKIKSYGPGNEWLFDQEYPATPEAAFRSPTKDPLINPTLVARAMRASIMPDRSLYPLIVGVDPAEFGRDRTAIAFRCGRVAYRVQTYRGKSTMEVVAIIGKIVEESRPSVVFIDRTGIGAGVVDRCIELGMPVIGVHSGARASRPDIYHDKRSEMWGEMLAWFEDEPCRIVSDHALGADLVSPSHSPDSTQRMWLERKQDMRKRGVASPDLGDALALTFSMPVGMPEHGDGFPGVYRLHKETPGRSGY